MKYTTEQLDAIAAKLRDMPAFEKRNQEHSKQAAIGLLAREIAGLQKRGYTLGQIAEALRGEGLDIATPTLKAYLLRTKARKASAPPKKKAPPGAGKDDDGAAKPTASFASAPDTDDI